MRGYLSQRGAAEALGCDGRVTVRILLLRALKLGDFLAGVPAFRAVRRAFPAAHIQLAAPRELQPLVDLLDGAIDELVHSRELDPLPSTCRDADLGIDLHGCGPASHHLLLDAGAKRLIAFRRPETPESAGGPEHDLTEHEVTRWCRLLDWYGISADASDLDLPAPLVPIPQRARDATLIHPGASSEARCWPVERWTAVAHAEQRAGRRVVITGGATEADRARAIARGAGVPSTHVYAGKTSLRELAALVAASNRVVCGDTGVAHLATAYRRPSVVLFGPTPPSTWGPPARSYHRVIWSGITGDPHGLSLDAGLSAITTERVIAELHALPASG